MKRVQIRRNGWLVVGLLAFVGAVQAADGIDQFALLRAIPADVGMAVDARSHDGMQFVQEQYARVWKAIEKQDFPGVLRRVIRESIKDNGGDLESFDRLWDQMTTLAGNVQWQTLGEREFAFAMRIAAPVNFDWVYMFRPPTDRVAKDFDGLKELLTQAIAMAPEGSFQVTTEDEGAVRRVHISLPNPEVPFGMTLAMYKEDVIVISFGQTIGDQVLAMLAGEEGAPPSIRTTPRFQEAFKKLPTPQDSLAFFDIAQLMSQMQIFAGMAAKAGAADMPAGEEADANPLVAIPALVKEVDIFDYVAMGAATDGLRTTSDSVCVLRDDAKSRALYPVMFGNKPIANPLRYVPEVATNVSVTTGVNLQALYQEVMKFLREKVPGGTDMVTEIDQAQKDVGIDVEEEFLSWIGGSFVTFSAPIPNPYMPSWALIVEVKNEDAANNALNRLYATYEASMAQQGGAVEDAKLDTPGFKRIIMPAMAAMIPGIGKPVVGVHDGHLFIANSDQILDAVLKAGAGEGKTFADNPRFKEEGLPLTGPVVAYSFSDLSKLGETLGQQLPMFSMMLSFIPDVQKNPVLSAIAQVLGKAANVAKELDFFRSSCTVTTFDGKTAYSKSVLNYQKPISVGRTVGETSNN